MPLRSGQVPARLLMNLRYTLSSDVVMSGWWNQSGTATGRESRTVFGDFCKSADKIEQSPTLTISVASDPLDDRIIYLAASPYELWAGEVRHYAGAIRLSSYPVYSSISGELTPETLLYSNVPGWLLNQSVRTLRSCTIYTIASSINLSPDH